MLVTNANQEKQTNLGSLFTIVLSEVQANYNDMQLSREHISVIMFPLSKRSLE